MDDKLARREVLLVASLAGVGAVAAACTGGSTTTNSSAPPTTGAPTSGTSGASGATTAGPSSGTPTSGAATTGSTSPPDLGSGPAQYATLAKKLSGTVAVPGQRSYRPNALLYNPRFANQPKPQAIAYCKRPSDVVECVRFAAAGAASLRVRNGGHSYGGWSSGPGLVIDLAAMNSVRVDQSAMTATIGAGALLADVYSALDANGVSIGAGSCATVGVTGLTLGGGIGLLTRSYGLTCDQLASIDVVTADGKRRTVDAHRDPELFWALRGGGGSFAAVTALTFDIRPAPRVQQVFLQWDASSAADVLGAWQQWSQQTPRQLMSTCKVLAKPGSGVRAVVAAFWVGSGSPAAQVSKLLRATPAPAINSPSSDTYGAAMLGAAGCSGTARSCIAAALTPAQRLPEAAASSILQKPLPDKAIAALVSAVESGMDVPGMVEGGVSLDALGGAVSDIAADGSAFPWRSAIADIQYTATWQYAQATVDPGRYDRFVHRVRAALTAYVGESGYANYADPQLRDYGTAYWGSNLPRLQQVKRTYDPHELFVFPQSVPI